MVNQKENQINRETIFKRISICPIWIPVAVIFFISLLGFLFVPFTGDVYVFMSAAHQADFYGKNLIYNSFMQWELKGVYNRLINYIIYKIALHFSEFSSYRFEIVCLSIYATLILCISYISSSLVELKKSFSDKIISVMLCSSLFFTAQIMCRMQAEMTGVLLLLLSFSIYINAIQTNRHVFLKTLFSGMLIGAAFFLKSPLIILSISFVCLTYIWERKHSILPKFRRYFLLAAGSIITLMITGIIILLIHPEEFQEMVNASIYQSTLLTTSFSAIKIVIFALSYLKAAFGNPVLLLGSVAFLLNFIRYIYIYRDETHQRNCVVEKIIHCIVHIMAWIVPAFYVILSNRYFYYHYFVFAFPCLLELWMFCEDFERRKDTVSLKSLGICVSIYTISSIFLRQQNHLLYINHIFLIMAVTTIVIFLTAVFLLLKRKGKISIHLLAIPLLFSAFLYINYVSIFSENAICYIELNHIMYKQKISLPVPEQEDVLYLDDGVGSFLIGNKSYLREYYPLPLQRINEEDENTSLDVYKDAFRHTMNYDGNFISVYENWFFGNDRNSYIKEKIEREYRKIGSYPVYSIHQNIFKHPTESSLEYYDIYQRILTDN